MGKSGKRKEERAGYQAADQLNAIAKAERINVSGVPNFVCAGWIATKIAGYFEQVRQDRFKGVESHVTIAGIQIATTLSESTEAEYKNGKLDYIVQQRKQGIYIKDRYHRDMFTLGSLMAEESLEDTTEDGYTPQYFTILLGLLGIPDEFYYNAKTDYFNSPKATQEDIQELTGDILKPLSPWFRSIDRLHIYTPHIAQGKLLKGAALQLNQELSYTYISELLQKTRLFTKHQAEERLYNKGRVGDIFALKALYGWQDQPQSHAAMQLPDGEGEDAIKRLGI